MSKDTVSNARRPLSAMLIVVALGLAGCSPANAPSTVTEPTPQAESWTAISQNGLYRVTIGPQTGSALIGSFHEWRVTVQDRDGAAVHPAAIRLSGGMPAHGHGLPTQPQVTEHLGDGAYRIEGVRFNMAGDWELALAIDASAGSDTASFAITMAF